jgi:hypothetical protein
MSGLIRRQKEDKLMTAAGDALYLPVPSTVPKPLSLFPMRRQDGRERKPAEQHRIRRLPRHDFPHIAYTSSGYQVVEQVTGKIVDIYT